MSVLRITYLLSRRGGNEADVSPLRLLATFRSSAGPGQFLSKNDTGYRSGSASLQQRRYTVRLQFKRSAIPIGVKK